jgi:hypothetical protein
MVFSALIDIPVDASPDGVLLIDIDDCGEVAVLEPPPPQPARTVAARTMPAADVSRVRWLGMGDLRGRWVVRVQAGVTWTRWAKTTSLPTWCRIEASKSLQVISRSVGSESRALP